MLALLLQAHRYPFILLCVVSPLHCFRVPYSSSLIPSFIHLLRGPYPLTGKDEVPSSEPTSTPAYLLIHAKTSRCQTREFSGLSTHCIEELAKSRESQTADVNVRFTWFSSGNMTSLLGMPLDCRTLKGDRPSVMGRR